MLIPFSMQLSTYARKDCSSSSKNLHAYMYYAVVVTPSLNEGAGLWLKVNNGKLNTAAVPGTEPLR